MTLSQYPCYLPHVPSQLLYAPDPAWGSAERQAYAGIPGETTETYTRVFALDVGPARPWQTGKDEEVYRIVPLTDPHVRKVRVLTTLRIGKQQLLWPVQSDNTPRNWIRKALDLAKRDSVTFSIPVTCHTFRHSFCMHLIQHGVPLKVVAYAGIPGLKPQKPTRACLRSMSAVSMAFRFNPTFESFIPISIIYLPHLA